MLFVWSGRDYAIVSKESDQILFFLINDITMFKAIFYTKEAKKHETDF
jgi:hypothetical protein